MSEFFFSGEPLPLQPSLEGMESPQREELDNFHRKLLDFIRRLGAKLSSARFNDPSGSTGAVETLALYRDTNFSLPQDVWTDLEWDRQIRVDAPYSHDVAINPEFLHFNQDGFYIMFLDIVVGSNQNVLLQLVDPDDSDAVLSWSQASVLNPFGPMPVNQTVAFHAHAGQNLAVQVKPDGNTAAQADETRITIIRSGDLLGGGSNPIDPCEDLEVWQLWC